MIEGILRGKGQPGSGEGSSGQLNGHPETNNPPVYNFA